MKIIIKSLAVATFLTLTAGAASAAEMAMECCDKCECCKDTKKPDGQAPGAPEHEH